MHDLDKTKWRDSLISLDWKRDDIKRLLGFRISRSISRDAEILRFEKAWSQVFTSDPMGYGTRQRKSISQFDFIAKATHMQPRDFIFIFENAPAVLYNKATEQLRLILSKMLTMDFPITLKKN